MIEFRAATPADAEAIAAVHVRSHRETYLASFGDGYISPPLEERQALWRRALPAGGAFVAAADGRVVGFGHAAGGRITTLYILRSHHRRGIGRRLMALLLDHLHRAGVAEARFEVLDGNTDAMRFYEALGATRIGREPLTGPHAGGHADLIYRIAARRLASES